MASDLKDTKKLDWKLLVAGIDKEWVDEYVYIKWLIIYPFMCAYLLIAFTSSIVYQAYVIVT